MEYYLSIRPSPGMCSFFFFRSLCREFFPHDGNSFLTMRIFSSWCHDVHDWRIQRGYLSWKKITRNRVDPRVAKRTFQNAMYVTRTNVPVEYCNLFQTLCTDRSYITFTLKVIIVILREITGIFSSRWEFSPHDGNFLLMMSWCSRLKD
jgi:hypothetical protein